MAVPLDAFVAGQYYGFYTPPNTLAAGTFNTPGLTPAGGPSYFYADSSGGARSFPSVSSATPLWIGATARGFTLKSSMSAEPVEGDIWGGSVVDIIYRGGNMHIVWDAIAFRYGSLVPFWPWSTIGTMGTVGRLGSVYGGGLVLVAAPGTTAADFPAIGQVHLQSISAANAILQENNAFDLVFDSRLRRVPVALRLLPYFDQLVTVGAGGTGAGRAGLVDATGSQQTVVTMATFATGASIISQVANYKWYSIA